MFILASVMSTLLTLSIHNYPAYNTYCHISGPTSHTIDAETITEITYSITNSQGLEAYMSYDDLEVETSYDDLIFSFDIVYNNITYENYIRGYISYTVLPTSIFKDVYLYVQVGNGYDISINYNFYVSYTLANRGGTILTPVRYELDTIPLYTSRNYQVGYHVPDDVPYIQSRACTIMFGFQFLDEFTYNTIISSITGGDYDSAYQNGYDDGFDIGFEQGYHDGFIDGGDIGEGSAYQQGYNDGYNAGTSTANPYTFARLFGAIADTPILILRNLLGFEVFGVQAIAIFMTMVTGTIAIFIIRKFI